MKKGFWTADWFAGLVITLVFLFFARGPLLQGIERTAYDMGVRGAERTPSERVAVIAIDDQSIANIGRWPWPRDVHARMIDILAKGKPKVIGNTVFFLEPQIDPGFAMIEDISTFYAETSLYREAPGEVDLVSSMLDELAKGVKGTKPGPLTEGVTQLNDFFRQSSLSKKLSAEVAELATRLAGAREALNTDKALAASMQKAGDVVLAMPFVLGEPRGRPDTEMPPFVAANTLENVVDRIDAVSSGLFPLPAVTGYPPIEALGQHAVGIGHLNANTDVDGGIRSEPLVLRYYDTYYPSLSLVLAAKSLNLGVADVEVRLGEGVRLGNLEIGTDPALQMYTFFYRDRDGRPAFAEDSFYDVFTGKIPPEKFRDKVVLIGATATGVGTPQVTPISPSMAPVLTLAHSVSSILNEDFFVSPAWAVWAEYAAFLLVSLFLIAVLPRLKAGAAFGISVVLLLALVITEYVLMTTQAMWIPLMVPATLLFIGYLLMISKRFLVTERGKVKSEAESAESNRMLGLAYQGKGDLDQAFACFRKLPVDDSVLDLIYNLALDFERKRQFNKAGAAYRYMADHNPKFRDIEQRMNRTKAMEETVMLGSAGGSRGDATLLLDGAGGMQKPMLGRYQVEKELGKGAMGVVYLGRDPKINRVVAIKTMALSQEFEEDELDEVKSRFFREAETAGRLNHPNIVTIYDAGEEHDLAYIAMEFLKGKDLAPYTKKDALLPLPKVIDIVVSAAEALEYAHAQNVVHRDIKPANIMYEADTGSVKLTDFGIARITDSSKTKTGMVLGTPSYMSPEQLSGKKVDGRSDLFSLGVMLFQLSTGSLPFHGDSMATLMFKIANEEHPDPVSVRPDLPPCLKVIIDKALAKDVEQRYQRGAAMAQDLRACLQSISA